MLTWLQQNSERPWTAAELTVMLDEAGLNHESQAAKWLREQGAEWPTSFYSYNYNAKSMSSWSIETVTWAVSEG
jgi:hypothetical protein